MTMAMATARKHRLVSTTPCAGMTTVGRSYGCARRVARLLHSGRGDGLGVSPHNGATESASEDATRAARDARVPSAAGTFRWNLAPHHLEGSSELFTIFGVDSDRFDGDAYGLLESRVHPDDIEAVRGALLAAEDDVSPDPMSFRIVLPNGRVRMAWVKGELEYDAGGRPVAVTGHIVDMGESYSHQAIADARLRLLECAPTHTLDDLLEKTLDEAESLSGSRIGFYHFVDPDQENLTLQNWSTRTKAEYCKAEGKGEHYPIAIAGVWVECVHARAPVIHNDYASMPNKKGLPEGHAGVARELVVPVIRQGLVRAILGVGNKPVDYDQVDVEDVAMLADLAWDIAETKIAQAALEQSEQHLRLLYETMNEGVLLLRADGAVTFSNAAAQRMLGLTSEQIAAGTWMDLGWRFTHEDGSPLPNPEHPVAVALRTGRPVHGVTIGLFDPILNGCRWLLLSAVPVFEPEATAAREVFVTLADVTELKHSRESAEHSNELLIGLRDATSHLLSHPALSGDDVVAALRAIAVAFGIDCAYAYLDEEAGDVVIPNRAHGLVWHRLGGGVIEPPSEARQQHVFSRWRDCFSAGDPADIRVNELPAAEHIEYEARGVSCVLAVPVVSEGRLWGFAAFEASGEPRIWARDEVDVVQNAASRLGMTIELSERALRDSLTGLYNRRYLEEALGQALARSAREGAPLSVVMFDVDDFKAVNDRHGHAAGDAVLHELARHLRERTRAQDIAARIGGDEFVVVMPNASSQDAIETAEKWRAFVQSESPRWAIEGSPGVTVTVGVSSAVGGSTQEELLSRADESMLTAKASGRNRVLGV
jgi:diguanylate cyclase (GGDEF)-like protein